MSSQKFKIKFGPSAKPEKVLFACSFGESSIVLLDILVSWMKEQKANIRAKLGFELTVVFIDDSEFENYQNNVKDVVETLKEKYELDQLPVEFVVLHINAFFADQSNLTKLRITPTYQSLQIPYHPTTTSPSFNITDLLQSLPNRASRHDLLQIIKSHLLSDYITTHQEINTLLYASNMTTLANEVIALTVKGRGCEIHQVLTDGLCRFGESEVEVIHPLRDVAFTEIQTFINLHQLSPFTLIAESKQLMNKHKTINEVVQQYYETVDTDNTGNIVSTVVKTGAKLDEPTKNHTEEQGLCSCCGGKIYHHPQKWLRDISYTSSLGPQNALEMESLEEWKIHNKDLVHEEQEEKTVDSEIEKGLCYGCIVTLSSGKGLLWPDLKKREGRSTEEVLKDFVLDDDEE